MILLEGPPSLGKSTMSHQVHVLGLGGTGVLGTEFELVVHCMS